MVGGTTPQAKILDYMKRRKWAEHKPSLLSSSCQNPFYLGTFPFSTLPQKKEMYLRRHAWLNHIRNHTQRLVHSKLFTVALSLVHMFPLVFLQLLFPFQKTLEISIFYLVLVISSDTFHFILFGSYGKQNSSFCDI